MKKTINGITCESTTEVYFRKITDPISKGHKVWWGKEEGEDYDSPYILTNGRFVEIENPSNITHAYEN